MMCDPVAEFADAVESRLDLGTLDRTARENFDQVIPPEHVVLRSGQPGPKAKGEFRNDPARVERLPFLGQNVFRLTQHRALLRLQFHCVPPFRLTVASGKLRVDRVAERDLKPL